MTTETLPLDRACVGKGDLFFPPGSEDIRENEFRAKKMCHTCAYLDDCFETTMKEAADFRSCTPEGERLPMVGVRAGTNQWERRWFSEASPADLEELGRIYEEAGHKGALRLRVAIERDTPGARACETASPEALAKTYAVPVELARSWRVRNGMRPDVIYPRHNAWRTAMALYLADGKWKPRKDVVSAGAAAVPNAVAERRRRNRQRTLNGTKRYIATNTLGVMLNEYPVLEQKEGRDGALYVRIIPAKLEEAVARAEYEQGEFGYDVPEGALETATAQAL